MQISWHVIIAFDSLSKDKAFNVCNIPYLVLVNRLDTCPGKVRVG